MQKLRNLGLFVVVGVSAITLTVGFIGLLLQLVTGAHVSDFFSYWAAGYEVIHHGNPYGGQEIAGLQRAAGFPAGVEAVLMRNPPISLPIVYLFGFFSAPVAARLWLLAGVACMALSIRWVAEVYNRSDSRAAWLVLGFAPVLVGLHAGQLAPILLLGVAAFVRFCERRPFVAGVGFGLCLLKPHLFVPLAAVWAVWAVTRRRYAILAGFAAFTCAALLISYALAPGAWGQYRAMMAGSSVHTELIPCVSILLRRAVSPSSTWLQYVLCGAGAVWALQYYSKHRQGWEWGERLPLLLLVGLLVAPYMWYPDEIVLVPAILYGILCGPSRFAVMSAMALNAVLLLVQMLGFTLHSYWIALTVPAWLAWFVVVERFAQRQSEKQMTRDAERIGGEAGRGVAGVNSCGPAEAVRTRESAATLNL